MFKSLDDVTWADSLVGAAGDDADAAGAGGGVAGTAVLDAAGVASFSEEAGDGIFLIWSSIFLAGADCSVSDLVLKLSIAIMGNVNA